MLYVVTLLYGFFFVSVGAFVIGLGQNSSLFSLEVIKQKTYVSASPDLSPTTRIYQIVLCHL